MGLGPGHFDVEVAMHMLARKRPAAGYGKSIAQRQARRLLFEPEEDPRLLKPWGFVRTGRKPLPHAQGKPFDITASNQLWQTDMTRIW